MRKIVAMLCVIAMLAGFSIAALADSGPFSYDKDKGAIVGTYSTEGFDNITININGIPAGGGLGTATIQFSDGIQDSNEVVVRVKGKKVATYIVDLNDDPHEHIWVVKWDADQHWLECAYCGEKKDIAAHDWDECMKTSATAVFMEMYDASIQVYDEAKGEWIVPDKDTELPAKITLLLPYPEGTDWQSNEFVIVRMIDSGDRAGEIEYIKPTKLETGLLAELSGLSPVAVAWKDAVRGDVDGSEAVENLDAALLLQYLVGAGRTGTAFNEKMADVDGDYNVTASDASLILGR